MLSLEYVFWEPRNSLEGNWILSTGGISCHKIIHDKLSHDNSPGIAVSFWLAGGNYATLLGLAIINTGVVAVAMTAISGY